LLDGLAHDGQGLRGEIAVSGKLPGSTAGLIRDLDAILI
jgi:hypothetical protein